MGSSGEEEKEVEDYMNMSFGEVIEEAKDVEEPEEDPETKKTNNSLHTPMDASNSKGLKLMQKMGYKPGETLGNSSYGPSEPVVLELKHGREGIGYAADQKRKRTEAQDQIEKQRKEAKSEFREKVKEEHEHKRIMHLIRKAQRLCINLEYTNPDHAYDIDSLSCLNVLYRGYIRDLREKDRLSRLKKARLYSDEERYTDWEEPNLEDDAELDEFQSQPASNQLDAILQYLRSNYYHCFWCMVTYNDKEDMDQNCPGISEEDH